MAFNLINRDPHAKVGMRIRMEEMSPDEKNPVDEGLEGTIDKIDGIGTLHVKWDDVRYIGVIPNVDKYTLLPSLDDQIDFDIFESSDKPVLSNSKSTKAGKNFNSKFSKPAKKLGVKLESEKEIEETMTAGGGGGLAGASGYSYTQPLGRTVKKKKKKTLEENTTTSAISSTVDFLVTNLMGWGTLNDMSPPWPSLTKKAENGKHEDWWWQNTPTYNGGVITDLVAKTDDSWDDDKLTVDAENDLSVFKKEIDKNPKKYKQSVITIDKGFDLNIDPPNEDWKSSLQKGVKLKKEEISIFVDDLLSEAKDKKEKDKRVHTKKWDRCVKKVEEKNKENNTDYNPYAVCQSSIGYEGSILKKHRKKEDIEETTTFASVFGTGFPVTPAFAAKKGKHRPSKKPIWKGGQIIQKIDNEGVLNESKKDLFTEINKVKFVPNGGKYVKIKDRCAKYNNKPWCSQGAVDNPLELSDSTMDIVNEMSKKLNLPKDYILEKIKESFNNSSNK